MVSLSNHVAISRLWIATCLFLFTLACAADPAPSAASTATVAAIPTTVAPPPTATATPAPTPLPTTAPTRFLNNRLPTLVPTIPLAPTPRIFEQSPEPTPTPNVPLVHIGNTVYVVDLALTPDERAQGLSGRPSLDTDRAMLFVYERDGPLWFWMPDMHFPLDMVWIRADCTVAGVTADVPNPPLDTPRDQLPRYPASEPVRFVLEINAGQAETHGITAGSPVEFAGAITGQWGC